MSCHHCAPRCGCLYQVFLPDNPVAGYEFANVNLNGIGVLAGVDGVNVNFRGIVSGSTALTVTLDAGNNAIVLTFDADVLVADLPQATTTQRGVGETATDAEAQAKVSTTVFLTPSNLAALGASTTLAGLVELATNAETQAGVSTTLAVTPAGLASVIDDLGVTAVFADSVARAAAVPAFVGQFGYQVDAQASFVANGLNAGDWVAVATDSPSTQVFNENNAWQFTQDLSIFGDSTGQLSFANFTTLLFDTIGNVQFTGSTFTLSGGSFNLASTVMKINGTDIPANSVLTTSATPGLSDSKPIAEFLSTANAQSGWGIPSGTLVRTTFATYAGQTVSNPPTTAEMQALDNAVRDNSRRLGALVTDILSLLLPTTP